MNQKLLPGAERVQTGHTSQARLLSKPEVLDRVGVTYPTLWSWMLRGEFPRSRKLGGKAAWVESEVEAWIGTLPVRRLKGDKAPA
jgi:predicted DNA-binding transcriptional regulator AlpA